MATKRNKRANPIFVRDTEGIDGKRLAQYLLSLRKVGEADQTPVSTKSDADSWAKTHKPFPQSHLDFYPLGLVEEQLRGRYDIRYSGAKLVEVAAYLYENRKVCEMNLENCRNLLSDHFDANRQEIKDALNGVIAKSFQPHFSAAVWGLDQYGKFEYLAKNLTVKQKQDPEIGWEKSVLDITQNHISQLVDLETSGLDNRDKMTHTQLERFGPIIERELGALVEHSRDAGPEQLAGLTRKILQLPAFTHQNLAKFEFALATMSTFELPGFALQAHLTFLVHDVDSLSVIQKFAEFVKELSPESLVEGFNQAMYHVYQKGPKGIHIGTKAEVVANLLRSGSLTEDQSIAFAKYAKDSWAEFPKITDEIHAQFDSAGGGRTFQLREFREENSEAYEARIFFQSLGRKIDQTEWDVLPNTNGSNPAFEVIVEGFPGYREEILKAGIVSPEQGTELLLSDLGFDPNDRLVQGVLHALADHPNGGSALASLREMRVNRTTDLGQGR